MSMSLAELEAQDVKLLPERATLHRGGSRNHPCPSTRRPSPASLTSAVPYDTNIAVAAIVNL